MPCTTYESPQEKALRRNLEQERSFQPLKQELDTLKNSLAESEAMLCGVLSAILAADKTANVTVTQDGSQCDVWEVVRYFYDAQESGVSWGSLCSWWANHQAKDQAYKTQIRDKALSKLTPEERKILGV